MKVEEKKPYMRRRMREHYTCIDTQVSLQKSDAVDVLDSQQETKWLVRHSTDKLKVLSFAILFVGVLAVLRLQRCM